MRCLLTPAPSNAFQTGTIRFEEAKASQSDGGGSFKLSLYVCMKVSLMVIWSTGTNAWCSCQHRDDRHRWENNMSLLGDESSMIRPSKDKEPIGSNYGIWESSARINQFFSWKTPDKTGKSTHRLTKSVTKLGTVFLFRHEFFIARFNHPFFSQNHQKNPVQVKRSRVRSEIACQEPARIHCRSRVLVQITRMSPQSPFSSLKAHCPVHLPYRCTSDPAFPPSKCLYYK
jgi:hypothetical protein